MSRYPSEREIDTALKRLLERLAMKRYPGRMMQVRNDINILAVLWDQYKKGLLVERES